MTEAWDAVVIGAGPAGLMAAEELGRAGHRVLVAEAKPSAARKFLMAGKSGLNLTKDEPFEQLIASYGEAADWLAPMIQAFDAQAVQAWAQELGSALFTGSTGRVFPTVMKASPLLRAWLGRLDWYGVQIRTRWRWAGWDGAALVFETPGGSVRIETGATILALGGASWARLGSDGAWRPLLQERAVEVSPFKPANAGLLVEWSRHMAPQFGQPLKGIALRAGGQVSRGEAVISQRGLEGGGIYSVCAAVREGAVLHMDLLPDLEEAEVARRLSRPRGKASFSNHLRKALKLSPASVALLQEFGRPLPQEAQTLARLIKALPVKHAGLRPMDEAISTAGGVSRDAVDGNLMLKQIPGTFCAGEMLDWEAPTGGYLLTACLATGRWAGRGAADYLASAATR
ncbi:MULTISPECIES: TIGR03862 family flavoprotein [unclassified Leisingera]|uniref:TIGR03862 family flavoprotein n=1 Tax=unclassified Leisingera TaxID=2614906 RepID=UPI0002EBC298|nr:MULTISPECIES: TIGR03862 family flavoprotein [unclassified Leisingera]KIC22183.1 NAD(FAD)-utilizing dehydrogenase [Leisingera sp. ANG-S3]KIC53635.1 NAD(FAD)-utilizing dehydrogenase [Leisingera sp. ANG-S]KID08029.1 NAD(FAD)-utilizing dehydrogenase [Leisingera sp. ANG1]